MSKVSPQALLLAKLSTSSPPPPTEKQLEYLRGLSSEAGYSTFQEAQLDLFDSTEELIIETASDLIDALQEAVEEATGW